MIELIPPPAFTDVQLQALFDYRQGRIRAKNVAPGELPLHSDQGGDYRSLLLNSAASDADDRTDSPSGIH